ncbi:hypothetical protein DXG01_014288 [Tephrocybe rancida]|nr:hypothetical protein DXG01_014288 [Tephrocybe rancida]
MLTARDMTTNEIFLDDTLTDVEFDLICGTYVCHTGFGDQTAMRSWFPSLTTFEGSGEDYGRWNGQREDSFFRRLDEINNVNREASSRGPINAKKWRDLMRGTKELRRLRDDIEKWSDAFIRQQLTQ